MSSDSLAILISLFRFYNYGPRVGRNLPFLIPPFFHISHDLLASQDRLAPSIRFFIYLFIAAAALPGQPLGLLGSVGISLLQTTIVNNKVSLLTGPACRNSILLVRESTRK
jgi:hypothetical protein